MRFPFTTYLEIGDDEIELSVIYDVTISLISVRHGGAEYPLTDEQETALIAACEARADEDIAEESAAAAEWHAQARRDDMLMGDV